MINSMHMNNTYIYNGIDGIISIKSLNDWNHCVYSHVDFGNTIQTVDTKTHKYKLKSSITEALNCIDYNNIIYVYDKKKLLHFIDTYNLQKLFNKLTIVDVRYIPENYELYSKNIIEKNLNEKPIFMILDKIENFVDEILKNSKYVYKRFQNKFYDKIVIPSLYSMEKNKFIDLSKDTNPLYEATLVNSEYKIFNRTRPYSTYVNLDKLIRSKYRENGTLIEVDINAAVLQYMAKILLNDFVFGTNPIYYLQNYIPFLYHQNKKEIKDFYNRLIFDVNILNPSDIHLKMKPNKFITKLLIAKKELLMGFNKNGYLISPISGIKINNMTANNFMALMYQIVETEMNMLIIDKFNRLIENDDRIIDKHNNIIVYKYDSFIFDFSVLEFQTNQAEYKLELFKYILNDELKISYTIESYLDIYKNNI